MAQKDDNNLRPEEEDFSDITEFRPERSAFLGKKGPVPMEEGRTLHSVRRPWVILLLLSLACLFSGLSLFLFLRASGNQRTELKEYSSLIPESQMTGTVAESSSATEAPSVTISEKTKNAETATESTESEESAESSSAESPSEESAEASEAAEESGSDAADIRSVEYGGALFYISGSEATLMRCLEPAAVMSFPEEIDGAFFEGVNDEAFRDCAVIEVIELPDSVCWIGARAFEGCTELSELSVGKNLNAFSDEAFTGAEELTLVAPAGSYAESYAAEKGLKFRAKE